MNSPQQNRISEVTPINERILKTSLDMIYKNLGEFIGECSNPDGKPKEPGYGPLMKIRACLPQGYKHSFVKEK